jgi:hypothetical protein
MIYLRVAKILISTNIIGTRGALDLWDCGRHSTKAATGSAQTKWSGRHKGRPLETCNQKNV